MAEVSETPAAEAAQAPGAEPTQAPEAEAAQTPTADEEDTEPQTSQQDPVPGLLVDDTTRELRPGQMPVQEFMDVLQTDMRRVAEEILKGTGRTTEDCPYLAYWFDYYSKRSGRQVERAIHRYAPETAGVTRARDYIPYITARVRRGTEVWVKTGKVTEVPPGISTRLPASDPAERAASGGLLFKARAGGARAAGDPKAVQAELGDGRPLDGGVRSRMESAFGTSFAHVRTHNDARAADLTHDMNARAFTVGAHVAFGSGEYRPGTPVGDALIAHELAHVVQQGGADTAATSVPMGGAGYHALEQDADAAASGVMGLLWGGAGGMLAGLARNAIPRLRSGLQLQRCTPEATPGPTPAPVPPTITISTTPVVPPTTILPPSVTPTAGPTHLNFGQYVESIAWSTSGRSGFIVQELVNAQTVTPCGFSAFTGWTPTPHYWEAWEVDGSGKVTPDIGGVNDLWYRPAKAATSGSQSMDANVYWTTTLDPNANFTANNPAVPDARMLLATATPPAGLGTSRLTRHFGGTWDCTGTHTPA
jgi:hypothetical protein